MDVVVNGEVCTAATHVFDDAGNVVLKKDGTPKRRPGRKAKGGSAALPKPAKTKVPKASRKPKTAAAAVTAPDAETPAAHPAVAAPPSIVAQTTATVSRVYGKVGTLEAADEKLEVRTFVSPPANVEIGYGLTLNIGNYESARVEVKVAIPCYPEEADAAYEWAKKWAEERLQREVKDVRNISGPKPTNSPF